MNHALETDRPVCARTVANRKKGEAFVVVNRARCGTYYSKNKATVLAKKKADREADPEKFRERRVASRLSEIGLTVEQYEEMERAQKGLCAICQKPEHYKRNGKTRRLTVDHCHATGKIRGLLCGGCNAGLGMMKDDAGNLKRAAEYLEAHQ